LNLRPLDPQFRTLRGASFGVVVFPQVRWGDEPRFVGSCEAAIGAVGRRCADTALTRAATAYLEAMGSTPPVTTAITPAQAQQLTAAFTKLVEGLEVQNQEIARQFSEAFAPAVAEMATTMQRIVLPGVVRAIEAMSESLAKAFSPQISEMFQQLATTAADVPTERLPVTHQVSARITASGSLQASAELDIPAVDEIEEPLDLIVLFLIFIALLTGGAGIALAPSAGAALTNYSSYLMSVVALRHATRGR
jgi:hypothetical protein